MTSMTRSRVESLEASLVRNPYAPTLRGLIKIDRKGSMEMGEVQNGVVTGVMNGEPERADGISNTVMGSGLGSSMLHREREDTLLVRV